MVLQKFRNGKVAVFRFYKTMPFAVFRNFRVISMRFAVFLCYSLRCLYVFLCAFEEKRMFSRASPPSAPFVIDNWFLHSMRGLWITKVIRKRKKLSSFQEKQVLRSSKNLEKINQTGLLYKISFRNAYPA